MPAWREHVADLVRAVGRVDVDEDRADPGGGVLDEEPLEQVRRPDPDPVALLDAARQEAAGDPLDLGVQFAVGQAPAGRDVDDRLPVAEPLDGLLSGSRRSSRREGEPWTSRWRTRSPASSSSASSSSRRVRLCCSVNPPRQPLTGCRRGPRRGRGRRPPRGTPPAACAGRPRRGCARSSRTGTAGATTVWLSAPCATRSSTSRSRSDSCGNGTAAAPRGRQRRRRRARGRRSRGPKTASPRGDGPDRPGDVLRRRLLEQVAPGPGSQGREDRVVVLAHGQHDDRGRGELGGDPGRGLDPAHAGHAQVHEHDVGAGAARLRDRRLPVGRRADDVDARGVLQRRLQALAENGVVVGDQHAAQACVLGLGVAAPGLAVAPRRARCMECRGHGRPRRPCRSGTSRRPRRRAPRMLVSPIPGTASGRTPLPSSRTSARAATPPSSLDTDR